MAKVERSYQHIDPAAVGNEGRLVVSELGGRANTAIRARAARPSSSRASSSPRVLSQLIKRLESEGLSFEGAEASFELLIRRHQAGLRRRRSGSSTTRASSSSATARELRAEATVKVEVDGEVLHTAADGNGPVNALDAALRKALARVLPGARRRSTCRLQGAHPRRRARPPARGRG